ncbi:cadherin domain protein [Opisthorchis viverrini]|uniref:Cadherin domain protein n=1 Tax=Opisthorchis viverrini TaxID=6198 RepID=A0A1S8WZ40_OPIVI|nr:cadherin domain protein [Opisthorchis viverrini]
MLRNSPIGNKEDQKTPSPQLLSIDLIANPGRVTSMISSQEISETTPHIRLFPSTQWAVPYFVIRFRTSLVQELVLNRPIDRDHVCQTMTSHERNANSDDHCQCFRDQCPKLIGEDSSAQCEFRLTVTVYPLQPANVKFYMIRIILSDVNDNAPVFDLPNMEYHIFFKEDDPRGTARQLPTASDRDFCFNGQIEYSLLWTQVKDSKLFTLTWTNNSRLELTLKEGLDRETEHQYRLYLLAHDSGPIPTRHTTTLPLLITVEDANDCRPTFIRNSQHTPSPSCLPVNVEAPKPLPLVVSVPEDLSPGSLVYRIHAVDGDVGENAQVSYHFGPRVHPLSRRRLVPSSISHLYLRIRCHDYGNPRLASERTLHLRLWAEEDIKPRFNELEILSDAITPHCGTGLVPANGGKIRPQNDKGSSNFGDGAVQTACLTVSYAVEPGTALFRVDADSPKLSNPNYVIHYRIENDNTSDTATYFTIAADKGTVSIRRSLPRLPSRQVTLDIYASIEGAFIQSETTGIAAKTGLLKSHLRILLRLDYPDATEIELRHFIRNSDGKLEVEVLREPYLRFDISENASVGTRVMGTSALGCVNRGTESWSNLCQLQLMERKNDGNFQHAEEFRLAPVSSPNFGLVTYTLVTVATLDREQKSVYSLRVTVVGPTPIVPPLYILVHVLDANDNRPQLLAPFEKLTVTLAEYLNSQDITRLERHSTEVPYIVNISFSFKEPPGWVILRIPATDADVADNAKLAYFIQYSYTRNKDGHFSKRNQYLFYQLDQESGSLTVSKLMTRENLGSYLIKVVVRDHGQPEPLSTSAWIYLHVLDIPPFQQPVNDLPQITQRILAPDAPPINELVASRIPPSRSVWDGSGFVQSFWNEKHGKYLTGLFALLLMLLVSCPTFFIWLAYWKRVKLTGICCPNSRRTFRADRSSSRVCAANGSQEATHILRMTEMGSDETQMMSDSPKRSRLRMEQLATYQYPPGKHVADPHDHSHLQVNEDKSVNFGNECETHLLFPPQASISTTFSSSPTHWMSGTNGVSAPVKFPQANRSPVQPLRLSTPKHDLSLNTSGLVIYLFRDHTLGALELFDKMPTTWWFTRARNAEHMLEGVTHKNRPAVIPHPVCKHGLHRARFE